MPTPSKNRPAGPARAGAPSRRAAGISVIELMVVVALLGILVAVAGPSFTGLIQRTRAAGEMNSLVGDLQYARSEAIRNGLPVSLCPSANGSDCLAAGTWHSGWIVFTDPNRSGTREPAEAVVRRRAAWGSGDTLVAGAGMAAVTYGRDGFAVNLPAGTVTLPLRTAAAGKEPVQCLMLNRVGRQAVQRGGTESCT